MICFELRLRTWILSAAFAVTALTLGFTQELHTNVEHVIVSTSSTTEEGKTDVLNQSTNEVELRKLIDKLREERLDDRADVLYWWLTAVAIFLTLFAIAVPVLGYLGATRLITIEKDAKAVLKNIQSIQGEAKQALAEIDAQRADKAPEETKQATDRILESPQASPIERAMATALTLQRLGMRQKALEKWRALARVTEGIDNDIAARAWFSVGYLVKDESLEDCIQANDRAIALKPNYAKAYINRGSAKHDSKKSTDAIEDYNRAIMWNPQLDVAYYNRGIARTVLKQFREAITDFEQAIALKPDYAEAYYNRAYAKDELGQHGEAIVDYDLAIQLKPDYAKAYNYRGVARGGLGQHREAIADFDRAIALKPEFAEAFDNRAYAKVELGQDAEAISDFDEAIKLNKNLVRAYIGRGKAKFRLGDNEGARKDFATALEQARNTENSELQIQATKALRDIGSSGE